MSDQSSEQTLLNDSDQLNNAHLLTISQVQSTPPTKKSRFFKECHKKELRFQSNDSQEDSDWQTQLTKSIQQCRSTQSMKKGTGLSAIEKTVDIHNSKGFKYANICSICLGQYADVRGSLQCRHQFCFDCISKWCETASICPCCRSEIISILKLTKEPTQSVFKEIEKIKISKKQMVQFSEYDVYVCYECDSGDNEHVLLICDDCDFYCCHIYCDPTLNSVIPEGDWFCLYCRERRRMTNEVLNETVDLTQDSNFKEEEEEIYKGVASRTRSRETINQSFRQNTMQAFRNIRRGRRESRADRR